MCTLSLDTSGERLHRRGWRPKIGEAPLRETIAAALLQQVACGHARSDLRPVQVIDPMVGSGTFLLESAMASELAYRRSFAFFVFRLVEEVKAPERPPLWAHDIRERVGFEVDGKTLLAARENLQAVPGVTLAEQDVFTAEPLPEFAGQRWLFCNPPYGERLKVREPLQAYYEKLFAAAERVSKPDWSCFLLPTRAVKGRFVLPQGWRVAEKRPFVHGGLPVTLFVFGRTVFARN